MKCSCWNPARPMPTRDRSHQPDCDLEKAAISEARRLLRDAMRKFQK